MKTCGHGLYSTMPEVDFHTLDYLRAGNVRQKRAYEVLRKHRVFSLLEEFTPFLAGTIPIEIDTEGSDLDILCCYQDGNFFTTVLQEAFSNYDSFHCKSKKVQGYETIIATFELEGLTLEIFGQNIPVEEQYGYRHMLIEYRLLKTYGNQLRDEVIQLKKTGMKTEPAFAKALQLRGNAYQVLLELDV